MTSVPVHVVIVDDDAPVRRALARLLSAVGFRVSTYSSAEDFLVRSSTEDVSCVLLDVHLPRLSGLELTTLLARLNVHVPIVFITADHELAESSEMLRTGHPCLLKPIDDDKLLRTISAATAAAQDQARP
jgi:FixJ family two-component response regulator